MRRCPWQLSPRGAGAVRGDTWGLINELPEISHSQTGEIFMENAYEAAFGHRLN
ncbi:protein of unknown function [Methanoculleus bourgensis]|uniref:Uncharacterized protein n=1 Tax=Methanoculleus bourgensis TaxID=83986 RepID=A0A0X3BN04_9EURY|nr:protein of unknown function [Methanoculleus bourgensis]